MEIKYSIENPFVTFLSSDNFFSTPIEKKGQSFYAPYRVLNDIITDKLNPDSKAKKPSIRYRKNCGYDYYLFEIDPHDCSIYSIDEHLGIQSNLIKYFAHLTFQVVYSGNKSIHIIIKSPGATNINEYKYRWYAIQEKLKTFLPDCYKKYLEHEKFDESCIDNCKFTRCPGYFHETTGKLQQLVLNNQQTLNLSEDELNLGKIAYDEIKAAEKEKNKLKSLTTKERKEKELNLLKNTENKNLTKGYTYESDNVIVTVEYQDGYEVITDFNLDYYIDKTNPDYKYKNLKRYLRKFSLNFVTIKEAYDNVYLKDIIGMYKKIGVNCDRFSFKDNYKYACILLKAKVDPFLLLEHVAYTSSIQREQTFNAIINTLNDVLNSLPIYSEKKLTALGKQVRIKKLIKDYEDERDKYNKDVKKYDFLKNNVIFNKNFSDEYIAERVKEFKYKMTKEVRRIKSQRRRSSLKGVEYDGINIYTDPDTNRNLIKDYIEDMIKSLTKKYEWIKKKASTVNIKDLIYVNFRDSKHFKTQECSSIYNNINAIWESSKDTREQKRENWSVTKKNLKKKNEDEYYKSDAYKDKKKKEEYEKEMDLYYKEFEYELEDAMERKRVYKGGILFDIIYIMLQCEYEYAEIAWFEYRKKKEEFHIVLQRDVNKKIKEKEERLEYEALIKKQARIDELKKKQEKIKLQNRERQARRRLKLKEINNTEQIDKLVEKFDKSVEKESLNSKIVRKTRELHKIHNWNTNDVFNLHTYFIEKPVFVKRE